MESYKLQSVCVMALLLTALSRTVQPLTVCPVNNQAFLSTNPSLLPAGNIRASSQDEVFNPVGNFIQPNTSPWCTAQGEGDMTGHFIELNFTEPIVVQLLQSSGFVNGYVNNFTILYSMSSSGDDFKAYGVLEEAQSFFVASPFDGGYFSMEKPIVARRLMFTINGGVLEQASRLCWEIALYGCTLARAQTIQVLPAEPTTVRVTTPTTVSPSTDQLLTTRDTAAEECPPPDGQGLITQDNILVIALPIALATIVIVLVLIILGILICICVTRRRELKEPDYDTVTVKMLNNRTRQIIEGGDPNSGTNFHYDSPRLLSYDVPRAVRSGSLSVSSTDALNYEIKNPVYSMKRACAPDTPLQLALMNIPDESSVSNDYETIPEGVTSTENKLYGGLHRSHSQPHHGANPPNNNNDTNTTITTPVSVASSSDISTLKEKLAASDTTSTGGGSGGGGARSSSTTPKQMTYEYASVNKSGMTSNRRVSEPSREGSAAPMFETLYEATKDKNKNESTN